MPGTPEANSRLNWRYAIPAGGHLTDYRYRRWLESIKAATWWYRETDENGCTRASSAIEIGKQLRMFAAWAIGEGISSPGALGKEEVDQFIVHVASLGITENSALTKFVALRQLWLLRDHLPYFLASDPFPIHGEMTNAARNAGKLGGHTLSLEPRTVFYAFNEALKWLKRIDDIKSIRNFILEIAREYDDETDGDEFRNARGALISTVVKVEMEGWSWLAEIDIDATLPPSEQFRIILGRCYGAMLVLLFGFVAFRKHEAAYLTENCIELKGVHANMSGRVRKTSATPTGKQTERAVHEVVVQVVSALKSLAEDIRPPGHTELLITDPVRSMVYSGAAKPATTNYIYSVIDEFARSIIMEISRPLRPHMLRRAFCQLHIWRYELGDLDTLSGYMFHAGPQYTLQYISAEDAEKYLPEGQRQLAFDILSRNLAGETELAGGFSSWLRRYRDRLQAVVRVLSVERLVDALRRMMARQDLWIVAGPHGYCVRSRLRDRLARCSTDGRHPDYGNRTDVHCSKCPNFLVHVAFLDHWIGMGRAHKAVLDAASAPSPLVEAARRGLSSSNRIIEQLTGSRA